MKSFKYFNPVAIRCEYPYLQALDELLKCNSRILIVTTSGILKRFPNILGKIQKCNVDIFSNIIPNPQLGFLQQVKSGLQKYEYIIAIGGGSVMDSAKFLSVDGKITPVNGDLDIAENAEFTPIYAIPTTAGTSSELTKWATIWDMSNSIKYSLNHEKLYPKVAYYDTYLMTTLSRSETINGALDTLSHSFESIWNKNSNPISLTYALKAIDLVLDTLPKLLNNLNSVEMRQKITLSNIYAGLAFSNTQTALAHALSYPMTIKMNIPHGIACSITLPILMQNMQECEEKKLVTPYISKIIKLFEDIEVSTDLRSYGITRSFIDEIFKSLNPRAKNGLFDIGLVQEKMGKL